MSLIGWVAGVVAIMLLVYGCLSFYCDTYAADRTPSELEELFTLIRIKDHTQFCSHYQWQQEWVFVAHVFAFGVTVYLLQCINVGIENNEDWWINCLYHLLFKAFSIIGCYAMTTMATRTSMYIGSLTMLSFVDDSLAWLNMSWVWNGVIIFGTCAGFFSLCVWFENAIMPAQASKKMSFCVHVHVCMIIVGFLLNHQDPSSNTTISDRQYVMDLHLKTLTSYTLDDWKRRLPSDEKKNVTDIQFRPYTVYAIDNQRYMQYDKPHKTSMDVVPLFFFTHMMPVLSMHSLQTIEYINGVLPRSKQYYLYCGFLQACTSFVMFLTIQKVSSNKEEQERLESNYLTETNLETFQRTKEGPRRDPNEPKQVAAHLRKIYCYKFANEDQVVQRFEVLADKCAHFWENFSHSEKVDMQKMFARGEKLSALSINAQTQDGQEKFLEDSKAHFEFPMTKFLEDTIIQDLNLKDGGRPTSLVQQSCCWNMVYNHIITDILSMFVYKRLQAKPVQQTQPPLAPQEATVMLNVEDVTFAFGLSFLALPVMGVELGFFTVCCQLTWHAFGVALAAHVGLNCLMEEAEEVHSTNGITNRIGNEVGTSHGSSIGNGPGTSVVPTIEYGNAQLTNFTPSRSTSPAPNTASSSTRISASSNTPTQELGRAAHGSGNSGGFERRLPDSQTAADVQMAQEAANNALQGQQQAIAREERARHEAQAANQRAHIAEKRVRELEEAQSKRQQKPPAPPKRQRTVATKVTPAVPAVRVDEQAGNTVPTQQASGGGFSMYARSNSDLQRFMENRLGLNRAAQASQASGTQTQGGFGRGGVFGGVFGGGGISYAVPAAAHTAAAQGSFGFGQAEEVMHDYDSSHDNSQTQVPDWVKPLSEVNQLPPQQYVQYFLSMGVQPVVWEGQLYKQESQRRLMTHYQQHFPSMRY